MKPDEMKWCKVCDSVKPLADFYQHRRNSHPYALCKPCHNARTRKWQDDNPDKKRKSMWSVRGIDFSAEQYDELHQLQGGLCAICGRPEPTSGRRLAVDHSHTTGKVRGLLCTKCNTTVGWVEMHPALNAYLERK